jgi:hypothetical protein
LSLDTAGLHDGRDSALRAVDVALHPLAVRLQRRGVVRQSRLDAGLRSRVARQILDVRLGHQDRRDLRIRYAWDVSVAGRLGTVPAPRQDRWEQTCAVDSRHRAHLPVCDQRSAYRAECRHLVRAVELHSAPRSEPCIPAAGQFAALPRAAERLQALRAQVAAPALARLVSPVLTLTCFEPREIPFQQPLRPPELPAPESGAEAGRPLVSLPAPTQLEAEPQRILALQALQRLASFRMA